MNPGQARRIAVQAAARYLPPQYRGFFIRQMDKESHFRDETSPVGAQGYGQWMPATAKAHGVNPHDPVSAYNGAAKMMAGYLHSYNGNYAKALAAYNAGPAAVAHYGGIPPYAETRRYVRDIMGGLGGTVEGAPSLPSLGQRLTNPAPAPAPRGPNLSALLQPSQNAIDILKHQGGTLGRISDVLDNPITIPHQVQSLSPDQAGMIHNAVMANGQIMHGGGLGGGFIPRGGKYVSKRADQGRDLITNPGGPLIAPGAGYVVRVGSDPRGFGPAYPIVRFTSGPYKGRTMYVGHTISALKQGQRFRQGSVISHTAAHGGLGNATTPGWAEVGYAPGGTPGRFGQPTPFK